MTPYDVWKLADGDRREAELLQCYGCSNEFEKLYDGLCAHCCARCEKCEELCKESPCLHCRTNEDAI